MTRWFGLASVVLALASSVEAAQIPPAPIPEGTVMAMGAAPISLYECVRYKDLRNIHPCAVEKIVSIKNPCYDPCDACSQPCVFVKICVPPCECYDTKCRRNGKTLVYDFGDYEVAVRVIGDHVVVDYDD
jgi:hypothetical protein